MFGIFASLAGFTGMMALWALAWWLWNDPARPALHRPSHRRPIWQNEPTPRPQMLVPPPSWLFDDSGKQSDGTPVARERPISSENTRFFTRPEVARAQHDEDETEILSEADVGAEDPNPSSIAHHRVATRLYGDRRPPKDP